MIPFTRICGRIYNMAAWTGETTLMSLGCYSHIHITWMRVYVTTLTVKVLQRHALRSQNLTQSHRYHHNPFHFTLFKVLIRNVHILASFRDLRLGW